MENQEDIKKAFKNVLSCVSDGRNQWHGTTMLLSNMRKEYEEKLELLKSSEENLASKSDECMQKKAALKLLRDLLDELESTIGKLGKDAMELENKVNQERDLQTKNKYCYTAFMSDLEKNFHRAPDMFSDENLRADITDIKAAVQSAEEFLNQKRHIRIRVNDALFASSSEATERYNSFFADLQAEISDLKIAVDSLERVHQSEENKLSNMRKELKKRTDQLSKNMVL